MSGLCVHDLTLNEIRNEDELQAHGCQIYLIAR